ncbi:MAG TPA: hypothetical protein PK620_04060 [Denitromonas sp.]|nr:hypothetical protein [Denitromonas sp.]HQU87820.1 hypothetical protein [Denitromonas sp.]HQV14068.1 hypothetical protein [Denitromonas sp.]
MTRQARIKGFTRLRRKVFFKKRLKSWRGHAGGFPRSQQRPNKKREPSQALSAWHIDS